MAEQAGPQSAGTSDGTFKGFERCLPENCVEYMLFIIDSQLQPQQIFSRLETVRKAAVQLSSQLTSEYIWQRDAFGLEVTTDKGADTNPPPPGRCKVDLIDRNRQAWSICTASPTMEIR